MWRAFYHNSSLNNSLFINIGEIYKIIAKFRSNGIKIVQEELYYKNLTWLYADLLIYTDTYQLNVIYYIFIHHHKFLFLISFVKPNSGECSKTVKGSKLTKR